MVANRAVYDRAVYDYVVVGGGSAGAVVAGRLAEATASVLLLEAGGTDRRIGVRVPAGVGSVAKTSTWRYATEPDPTRRGVADARSVGRILGGGGSINSCVFIRGHRADFDGWAKAGAVGWDHDSVLPYFKRMESWELGGDDYRGGSGPIAVAVQGNRSQANMAFLAAAREAGYSRNPDHNAGDLEGAGLTQVNQRRGLRSQASHEYLHKLAPREHLTVTTDATVSRVLFEGDRAVGVEFVRGGAVERAYAREEVVICAGAFGSPKLLMLSGIGPRAELTRVGIETRCHLPGVGRNLHDHVMVIQRYKSRVPTINKRRVGDFARGATDFLLHGTGILATTVVQAIAMHRTDPALEAPDTQVWFADFAISRTTMPDGTVRVAPSTEEGFNAATMWLTPRTRGRVTLRTSAPDAAPIIEHHLLADADDMHDLLASMVEVRRVMEQPAMAELHSGPFDEEAACRTEADWEKFARANAAAPSHPVGTCKMGIDDMAVVDPELRVPGTDGLRVADSSVMPTVTRGNTNAPSMMIGERAADLLLRPNRRI